MAVRTRTLGITCTHTVHTELIWHGPKHRQTQRTNIEARAHKITQQCASLFAPTLRLLHTAECVWVSSSRGPSAALSLELRGAAALRSTHWSLDAASSQDLLTASHTYRWRVTQRGNTWVLLTVRLLLMYSTGALRVREWVMKLWLCFQVLSWNSCKIKVQNVRR